MLDCRCGKPVRLGAQRVSANRRRGVYNYIVHTDQTQACDGPWESVAFKPYPLAQEHKEYFKLIQRWEAHQRSQVPTSGDV